LNVKKLLKLTKQFEWKKVDMMLEDMEVQFLKNWCQIIHSVFPNRSEMSMIAFMR